MYVCKPVKNSRIHWEIRMSTHAQEVRRQKACVLESHEGRRDKKVKGRRR